MTTNSELMGNDSPADKKVPVRAGDWDAMKRAVWRSKHLSEIVEREALDILGKCKHLEGCPGEKSETESCFGAIRYGSDENPETGCPDRELRMSTLVILTAVRQLAPNDARKPGYGPYFAPSREYFSDVIAAFATMEIENELFRKALLNAGLELPQPPVQETR